MPVDLTFIPERAKNKAPPSVRRSLVFLLILMAVDGPITSWIWPAGVSTNTPQFWLCFPGIAIIIWSVLMMIRGVVFLVPIFGNDGWNDKREEDIAHEIQRGQRSVTVLAQTIQLPHVVSTESLSKQLQIPGGITLPPVVDSATQRVIHQARFSDMLQAKEDRLAARLQALLSDGQIMLALRDFSPQSVISIALLTGSTVTPDQKQMLARIFKTTTGLPFQLDFVEGEALGVLDDWLDEPQLIQTLLVLAVSLSDEGIDGSGEAAVALLLQSADYLTQSRSGALVHRPEQTHPEQGPAYAIQQALLWGRTTPEMVQSIWLTGTGAENKADSMFSGTGMRFPDAEQPCDIDLRTGLTGCVSPWLAIAVAVDNLTNNSSVQLIMSVAGETLSPWFMVVRPSVDHI